MKPLFSVVAMLAAATPALSDNSTFEFRLGFDSLLEDQSDIDGLVGASLFRTNDQGYYLGGSIYSAAIGDGGGFFAGGFEVGKTTTLWEDYFVDASLFVGGGGGSSQVNGDGLMLRPQIHAGYDFGEYRIGVGSSWISVSGSDIATPTFALTLTKDLNLAVHGGNTVGTPSLAGEARVTALKPIIRHFSPIDSQKTTGGDLENMLLLGAEVTLQSNEASEIFIQASGVADGDAEGYAQWILGSRQFWGNGTTRGYLDFGAGFGGGGEVDTGGGLIAEASVGMNVAASDRLNLEFGVGAVTSVNGDFTALTSTAKASFSFGDGSGSVGNPTETRWQLSTGITHMFGNEDFHKPGSPKDGDPTMVTAEIDLFLAENVYLTGQAYTALSGDSGGFQMGLIGLGYTQPIADRLSVSGELTVGAAGGAYVNAQDGFLVGYKAELDYQAFEHASVTLGVGQVQTLQSGGMQPTNLSLGLKVPFTTGN